MNKFCAIGILSALLAGCVGYDSTLFVTKTNYGLDLSTTPPAFSFDISRTEGVISPQFEDGKTLPILASFKASGNNVFSTSLGSTFATGDAATTLANLYNSPVTGGKSDASLQLNSDPKRKSKFNNTSTAADFQTDDVRPVMFGTRTSVGMGISWSNLAASFPDSFNLGYNRKELALVPITKRTITAPEGSPMSCTDSQPRMSGTFYCMNMSPLLATLEFYNELDPVLTGKEIKSEMKYLQYFATGNAATSLATHPEVRMAMITRLDPAEKFRLGSVSYGLPLIVASLDALKKISEHDSYARSLYDAVINKEYEMPITMTAAGINPYRAPNKNTISADIHEQNYVRTKNFGSLTAYLDVLIDSVKYAEASLALANAAKEQGTNVIFKDFGAMDSAAPGRTVTDSDLKKIASDLEKLRSESVTQQKRLASDADIFAAFEYMSEQLANRN